MEQPVLSDVKSLLRGARISDITRPQTVCVLKDTTTLYTTLKTLAEHGILSAPVVKAAPEGAEAAQDAAHADQQSSIQEHGTGDVLGFVDVRDILLSFLAGVDVEATLRLNMLGKMNLLEHEGAKFCESQVKDITSFGTDGDFLHSRQSKASLWEMIYSSMLYPDRRGTGTAPLTSAVHHRMAIFNHQSEITHLVSQSDIIRYIHAHKSKITSALSVKVADVPGLCKRAITSIGANESAFKAIAIMGEHDISAIAVLDDGGRLIGNFSMSEMRSIMAEHFGALALPVGEFLALEHGTEYAAYGIESQMEDTQAAVFAKQKKEAHRQRKTVHPGQEVGQDLLFLEEKSTFGDLLDMLVANRVHRMYMVDADQKPIGVTTLTDILHCIADKAPVAHKDGNTSGSLTS